MQKIIQTLVLVLAACIGMQAQAKKATAPEAMGARLESLTREWADAMLHHDKAKLENLMAPEYVLRFWDGNAPDVARAAWLDNLMNHMKVDRWEQKSVSAHVYGNTGIVTSKYSWAGTMRDTAFDSKGYITDVWILRDKRWQVVSRTSGAIPGSFTKEGQKITW